MWRRIPRDGIADALAIVTPALTAPRCMARGVPLGHPLTHIAWRRQQPCAAADPRAVARPRQAREDPRRGDAASCLRPRALAIRDVSEVE